MSVNMAEQEPITVVGIDLGKTWTEVRIPVEREHLFRFNVNTDSG